MRPVVRKEEEVETGADRADEAQGGGCWIENVPCGWREWKESKTRWTGSNVLSGDNHDKTKQDKQAKHAAQPRLPVSPSSALRTWICCCYRAACSALLLALRLGSRSDLLCSGLRSLSLVRHWIHPLHTVHFSISLP